jgi:hypothetical protein
VPRHAASRRVSGYQMAPPSGRDDAARALARLWPAHPSACPRHGRWPTAPSTTASACRAVPHCTPAVEAQVGTLAVRVSRPRRRSDTMVDACPPAVRNWCRTTRCRCGMSLVFCRTPGARQRGRTSVSVRPQMCSGGMFAPGIVQGEDLELLWVNRSGGLVNGPWLIKVQQGPQPTLAPRTV